MSAHYPNKCHSDTSGRGATIGNPDTSNRTTLSHPIVTLRRTAACAGMTRDESGMTRARAGVTESRAVVSQIPALHPRTVGNIRRKCGFTLLEVMIALLVITLGMGAVIVTTGESAWKSSHLRESTIASWVAYNEIAMFRAKRTWSEATSRSGETEMANTQWNWQMKISATDDPSLRRVDVEVFIDGDTAVKSRVTGFIGRL